MVSNNQPTIGAGYLLPFLIFFTVIGVALLQPDYGSLIRQESSIVNQVVLSLAYALAFIFLLKKKGLVSSVIRKVVPLDMLFFIILISALWSEFPVKVIISFVHNIGVVCIALCAVTLFIGNKNYFFKLLLLMLFVYIVATVVVTIIRPDIGVMTSSNIYAVSLIGRWRGLTTHPNSLGSICLFATWVSLSTFFYTKQSKLISLLAIGLLMGAFYCMYKANSMTSTLLSAALVFGMVWFAFIGKSTGGMKFIKIMLGVMGIFVGLMLIYIIYPEVFSEKYFFRAIGRDESFSGRTSLWDIGLRGFAAKPYFGWSYDSLMSFLKSYNLGYGQLHNGYLDLLVRGGLVSIFLFFILLCQSIYLLVKQAGFKNKDYACVAGLLVSVLLHNMTEGSLFGGTNIVWFMFLFSYFYFIEIGISSRFYKNDS
jgi:O-antigen ligase